MNDFTLPSLIAIDGFRLSAPFDRSLAALDIRHKSNSMPEEGYDISLSASLAPQAIILMAGDAEIEVVCEIMEAEVQLTSKNTKIDPGRDYHEITESRKSLWKSSTEVERLNSKGSKNELSIDSAGPSGNVAYENGSSYRHKSSGPYDPGFYHSTLEILRIKFKDGRVLDGPIVEGYSGWIAKPENTAEPSGVRLDLIVREQWMRFSKVEVHSSGSFAAKIRTLLDRSEYRGSEKRKLFEELLRKLAIHGLRARSSREAVLDSVARILLPNNNAAHTVKHEASSLSNIPISHELLGKFLDADESDARAVYLAISKALETSTPPLDLKQDAKSKSFAPSGTVFSAIEALEKLNSAHQSEEYESEELKTQIGENTYNDLSALGFLKRNRKLRKISFQKFGGSAEVAVFRGLLESNWFEFSEGVLKSDVRISTLDLGRAVSDNFGLGWAQSSMKRNGQNIKKWVINLSPSLLPPDKDHPDFFYVNSFKRRAPEKGATPIITLEMAKIFEAEKLLRGVPYKDTAKRFGVAVGSYQNFRKREYSTTEEAENYARNLSLALFDPKNEE